MPFPVIPMNYDHNRTIHVYKLYLRASRKTIPLQIRGMESDSNLMAEAQDQQVKGLMKKLEAAEKEGARLREEASSLREEASVRARKAEHASKVTYYLSIYMCLTASKWPTALDAM